VSTGFDVVIRGGDVVDGTGCAPMRADVGIRDGRIAEVGVLGEVPAQVVIDARGRYVTPGFIDTHCHTDLVAFYPAELDDVCAAGVRQGVTTEVCGNCGTGAFPHRVKADGAGEPLLGIAPETAGRTFASLADFRAAVTPGSIYANLAPLLGHGTLRNAVVGGADRPATADELAEMSRLAAEAFDHGAFGFSTGLIYSPGMFADTEELVALAAVAGRFGRPYTTHMRDEGDHVLDALGEALAIGRRGGTAVQVSHHKIAGRRNWGRSAETLAAIEAARAGGLDVTIDVYPYTAGSTVLAALLPPWVLDGGTAPMLERLADRNLRDRIRQDFVTGLPGWQSIVDLAGWGSVGIGGDSAHAGASLAHIAHDSGRSEADVVADILLDDPSCIVIVDMMEDGEVASIGEQSYAMVGSDGIPGPGKQHPRLAGTFARVLHQHAGDPMRLADVVHRMTALPAAKFGVPDRGTLTRGAVADVVVVDPATVRDAATYADPLLPPTGIEHVLVAGLPVVRDGALTGAKQGTVLEPR
jgi:N-acyl-D-aspartate/D-glutamate deacylase